MTNHKPIRPDCETLAAQGRRTYVTRDATSLRRLRNRNYRRNLAALVRRDQATDQAHG